MTALHHKKAVKCHAVVTPGHVWRNAVIVTANDAPPQVINDADPETAFTRFFNGVAVVTSAPGEILVTKVTAASFSQATENLAEMATASGPLQVVMIPLVSE